MNFFHVPPSVALVQYRFQNGDADHCSEINFVTLLLKLNVVFISKVFIMTSSFVDEKTQMNEIRMLHFSKLGLHTDPNNKSKEPFDMLLTLTDDRVHSTY